MMRTLVYSTHEFDKPFLVNAAKGVCELAFTERALSEETVGVAEGFEAVALFTSDKANAEVLQKLFSSGVKFIALRSVGYDHVDLERAKQLGIKVANVPAYSPYSIAEHAVTLLMTLNRKILQGRDLMRTNDFRLDKLVGTDMHGKTVGIVGTGKIGRAFARIMHGFGCKLMAYDVAEDKELIGSTGIQYTTMEKLCELSDVISIHCPLNSQTKRLFNTSTFKKIKKGAFLINTARGGIVDTEAMIDALDSGIVAAAGLDVYENEKPIFFKDLSASVIKDPLFEKLRSHPNVLITGHQAFLTKEALQNIADTTVQNLKSWGQSGRSENELF